MSYQTKQVTHQNKSYKKKFRPQFGADKNPGIFSPHFSRKGAKKSRVPSRHERPAPDASRPTMALLTLFSGLAKTG